MGDEKFRNPFRPLLPDIRYIDFNKEEHLQLITPRTACVIVEPIQAEAGIVLPENDYLQKLRKRCDETGTLLIFDEVQTGFGRTGHLFAMKKYGVTPDIFTIAKGMGGGMPIGAFVASKNIMDSLKKNPGLGHITTFGGHPVSAAAAHKSLEVLLRDNLMAEVETKGRQYRNELTHPLIQKIWGTGLFLAVELESEEMMARAMKTFAQNGIITDQFIFKPNAFRIAPPLIIQPEQISEAIQRIQTSLDLL
jgi:acetylornithine/succinyldiaminopimelate/putrescine aminotransferase